MPARITFFFDFVDPLSYLLQRELEAAEAAGRVTVEAVGWELRPPPSPLTSPLDAIWSDRWEEARRRAAPGVRLEPGSFVPWTRKAHELVALARERGREREARGAIFRAHFQEGRDIGRIDELVRLGASLGFEATATKAALDVDHHQHEVLAARELAADLGVSDVPALRVGETTVRGFPAPEDLSTLLR